MQKSPFIWSKKDFQKKALHMEEFQKYFLDHLSLSFLGQKY